MGRPQNLQRTRHERATFPHPTVSKAAPFIHFPPLATRHPVETASDPIGQPWEINAGTGWKKKGQWTESLQWNVRSNLKTLSFRDIAKWSCKRMAKRCFSTHLAEVVIDQRLDARPSFQGLRCPHWLTGVTPQQLRLDQRLCQVNKKVATSWPHGNGTKKGVDTRLPLVDLQGLAPFRLCNWHRHLQPLQDVGTWSQGHWAWIFSLLLAAGCWQRPCTCLSLHWRRGWLHKRFGRSRHPWNHHNRHTLWLLLWSGLLGQHSWGHHDRVHQHRHHGRLLHHLWLRHLWRVVIRCQGVVLLTTFSVGAPMRPTLAAHPRRHCFSSTCWTQD